MLCPNCAYPLDDATICPGCGERLNNETLLALYAEFTKSKLTVATEVGITIPDDDFSTALFPHQRLTAQWALKVGKGLIASRFGLGKTRVQCEIARHVVKQTDKPYLVICPIGVKHQFQRVDGPALGQAWQYIRTDHEGLEAIANGQTCLISNYERVRDGGITPKFIQGQLGGATCDEGSVIRSLGSKTQTLFNSLFHPLPFFHVATATPSPNSYRELLNYAEAFDVMDRGLALTKWFMHNSNKAGDLRLFPQHEEEFWLWVSSWALFMFAPSDLGFSDDGYDLPELNVNWIRLSTDQTRIFSQTDSFGQHRMLPDVSGSIKSTSSEARATIGQRINELERILREHSKLDEQWVIWNYRNKEQDEIEKMLRRLGLTYSSIRGTQSIEMKETLLFDWLDKKSQVLLSKPEILGSGVNLQQSHQMLFAGIDPHRVSRISFRRLCASTVSSKLKQSTSIYPTLKLKIRMPQL